MRKRVRSLSRNDVIELAEPSLVTLSEILVIFVCVERLLSLTPGSSKSMLDRPLLCRLLFALESRFRWRENDPLSEQHCCWTSTAPPAGTGCMWSSQYRVTERELRRPGAVSVTCGADDRLAT